MAKVKINIQTRVGKVHTDAVQIGDLYIHHSLSSDGYMPIGKKNKWTVTEGSTLKSMNHFPRQVDARNYAWLMTGSGATPDNMAAFKDAHQRASVIVMG